MCIWQRVGSEGSRWYRGSVESLLPSSRAAHWGDHPSQFTPDCPSFGTGSPRKVLGTLQWVGHSNDHLPLYLLDAEVEAPWVLLEASMLFPPESFVFPSWGARRPWSRALGLGHLGEGWLMLSGQLFS